MLAAYLSVCLSRWAWTWSGAQVLYSVRLAATISAGFVQPPSVVLEITPVI